MLLQEYHFTIKFLAGNENSAADIDSRPSKYTLVAQTRSKTGNQTELLDNLTFKSSKNDIFDDIPLLYFIKNKKHMSGLSMCQVKRIEKVQDQYI